jgi:hypothetical protein
LVTTETKQLLLETRIYSERETNGGTTWLRSSSGNEELNPACGASNAIDDEQSCQREVEIMSNKILLGFEYDPCWLRYCRSLDLKSFSRPVNRPKSRCLGKRKYCMDGERCKPRMLFLSVQAAVEK